MNSIWHIKADLQITQTGAGAAGRSRKERSRSGSSRAGKRNHWSFVIWHL